MKKLTLASLLSVGSFLAAPAMAQQAAPSPTQSSCSTSMVEGDREWYYNSRRVRRSVI